MKHLYLEGTKIPYCNALSSHLCLNIYGEYKPCCRYDGSSGYHANNASFEEYRNSKFVSDIKHNMSIGWDKGCYKCALEEQRGSKSARQRHNEFLSGNDTIEFVELSISSQCNLLCRMCNAESSSKWATILNKQSNSKIDMGQFLSSIDWTNVTTLKYLGGESFITPEFGDLVEYLENTGIIQNINLNVITNATLFPHKHIESIKKFRNVTVTISIDGVDKVDEYIRHLTDWDVKVSVIDEWLAIKSENIHIRSHTVVQAYNLHDLKNIHSYLASKGIPWNPALILHPTYLRIDSLLPEYVKSISDSVNQEFISQYEHRSDLYAALKRNTHKYDKIFNKKYTDILPHEFFKE